MTLSNSSPEAPTHIRERNQGALRGVFSDQVPSEWEARFDKIEVELTAEVRGSRAVVDEYVDHLNDESDAVARGDAQDKLLNQFGNRGYIRQAKIRADRWTLTGVVSIRPNGEGARISLELKLNPTRTAQHALAENGYDELDSVPPLDFFRSHAHVKEQTTQQTLTRTDNALLGSAKLGGNETFERFVRNWSFLQTYEAKLIELIHETFLPLELGFEPGERSGHGRLASGSIGVSFNWANLRVKQAEVYWDRACPNALTFSRQLSERLMDAAPAARLRRYSNTEPERVERAGDSLAVTVPQRRNLDLVIYPKTRDRIRFEMRYHHDVSGILRGRPTTSSDNPLLPWLVRLGQHAGEAVPWDGIQQIMPRPPSTDALELLPIFAEKVRLACEQAGRGGDFAQVLSYLVESGGMSEGGEIDPDRRLIPELAAQQILFQVGLRRRPRGVPRRWVIDASFNPLIDRLRGR